MGSAKERLWMKIAFWSEKKGVGTTFNMAAVACASALLYPVTAAVVPTGYQDRDLERRFTGRRERRLPKGREAGFAGGLSPETLLVAETREYSVREGLDCLLRKETREELTREAVLRNMRQVVPDRLYCMVGSRRREHEWRYEDQGFRRLCRVMEAVEDCFDVVFLDCGSRKDDFTKKMLEEADLRVLNMDQEEELIGDYYRSLPKARRKTFFLVGNYFKDGLYTRENLERLYRVDPERLGAIPYNPQLGAASRAGRMDGGVRKYVSQWENAEFGKELGRTARLILKQAGAIS